KCSKPSLALQKETPFVVESVGFATTNSKRKENKNMHSKCTTKVQINKVRIGFTNKKMTAYGGFSLLAAFFEKINLREILQEVMPIRESSPNGMGIYSKVLAYILLLYAGGSRFSHLLYHGWQGVFTDLFAVRKLPLASTTLTR